MIVKIGTTVVVFVSLCVFLPSTLNAQSETPFNGTIATPIHGVGHDYINDLNETVNPATGSLSVRIQAPTPAERGVRVPIYAFAYDSSGQFPVAPVLVPCPGSTGTPCAVARGVEQQGAFGAPSGGMGYYAGGVTADGSAIGIGNVFSQSFNLSQPYGNGSATCHYYGEYVYVDMSGGRHPLNFDFVPAGSDRGGTGCSQFRIGGQGTQTGGDSQYLATIDDSGNVTVADVHGNQLNPNTIVGGVSHISDVFGNGVNGTHRQYSQTATSLTIPGLGAPYTYSVVANAPDSSTQTPYPYNISFRTGSSADCATMYMYGSYKNYQGSITVKLPNLQSFLFTADSTYGLIGSITYPTGAVVSYTWAMNTHGEEIASTGFNTESCYLMYDVPAVKSRIVKLDGSTPSLDQEFSYTTTYNPGNAAVWSQKTTTVKTTDLVTPGHPVTEVDYTYLPMSNFVLGSGYVNPGYSPVESQVVYRDGAGNVLKTINKVWNNPNQLAAECTTLTDGRTSGTFYHYSGSFSLLTDKKEYDYGAVTSPCVPPSSTPLRETATTYFQADNPSAIKVYGNGILEQETDYSYNLTSPSTVTPAPYNFSPLTANVVSSVTKKCFTVGSNGVATNCPAGDITTQVWWDQTGQATHIRDSNYKDTFYYYDDAYTSDDGTPPTGTNTHTYLTKIVSPQTPTTHTKTFQYGYNQGLLRSTTDVENNLIESYSYLDPWKRVREIDEPDGGVITTNYDDSARTVTTKMLMDNTAKSSTSISYQDQLGRTIETETDSTGQNPSLVTKSYTGLGQVLTVSNPHTAADGTNFGTTTFNYDALGRTSLQTNPDSTTHKFTYPGSTINETDENSLTWQRNYDALGRNIKVLEVSVDSPFVTTCGPQGCTTTPHFGAETDYSYDALNNLVCVDQWGASSAGNQCTSGRHRVFSYDSLSRLTSSTNPETGTISYAYASGSNLCAGDPSAVCSKTDARGVVTSFSYDALSRLTSKQYSDGTLPAKFGYDGFDENGSSISGLTYFVGRLSRSSNGANAATTYSYDKMGRQSSLAIALPSDYSHPKTVLASYDYTGNLTQLTYPDGRVVQQTFDTAGRLNSSATISFNSTSLNQSYFNSTHTYDAAGHLTSTTYPNGTPFSAAYDNRERLVQLTYGPSGPFWSKQFTYYPNGNMQSETDLVTGVQRQYSYDALNRLIGAQDIYSNEAVPSSSNGNTGSTSTSGSGAEETPGGSGALQEWTNPDESNLLEDIEFTNPQGLSPAPWIAPTTVTVTPSAGAAPDGTNTAFSVLGTSSASGPSDVYISGSVENASSLSLETTNSSVWLKSMDSNSYTVDITILENSAVVSAKPVTITPTWQQVSLLLAMPDNLTSLSMQIGNGSLSAGHGFLVWNPMVEDQGIAGSSVTNLLPNSQSPDKSTWRNGNGVGIASISANSATAPDSTQTAATITYPQATTYLDDFAITPSLYGQITFTGSVFLQVASGTLPTTVSIMSGGAQCGHVSGNITTTWQRVFVTCTTQTNPSGVTLRVGGAAAGTFRMWGAQLELAPTAGPYVATDAIPATMQTALTNLVSYSQEPANWSQISTTVSPDTVVAPDFSITASKLTATSTDSRISTSVPNAALFGGLTVTGSVYLKADSGTPSVNFYIFWVTASGTQYSPPQNAALSSTWQRFQITGNVPAGVTGLGIQVGGLSSFQSGEVVDLWGGQMEVASQAGPYIATTLLPIMTGSLPVNILPNSQAASGANWMPWGSPLPTVTSNYAAGPGDPSGSTTAALLTSNSTDNGINISVPNPSLYDNETVTASVYLRVPSTNQSVNLYIQNIGTSGSAAATMISAALTTTWQRFKLTKTLENGNAHIYLQIGGAGSFKTNQQIEVWGAQFVIGSDPAPYVDTNNTTTIYGSTTGQTGYLVPTGLNETYAYDLFGNILQEGSFNASYTANNQIFGYSYDAAGNLLSDGMNIMTWDAESRINTVGGATYIYDTGGNRVEKQGSAVTDTVYLGGRPIARLTSGQWTDLIYGPNGLLAEVPGTSTGLPIFRATDYLGNVVGSLLSNGNFVDQVDHTPFGRVFAGNTNDPYLFTGKERDAESGLDYFGARYYSSNMGRMMSPDWSAKAEPVPYAKLDNPQSLNLYSYVLNNPLRFIDPDGHYELNASNCGDNAKCQKKYDKAANKFEKQRSKNLNSKNESIRNAAANYGAKGEANGVHVGFGDTKSAGNNGGVDISGSGPGNPNINVTLDFSRAGNSETITHEGTHVGDDQKFLGSFDPRTGGYDQTLNPTHFQTEFNAFKAGAMVNHEHGFGPNDVQGITNYINTNYPARLLPMPVFPVSMFPAGVPDE